MIKYYLVLVLCLIAYLGQSQQFVNGDLEGEVLDRRILPDGWSDIPMSDFLSQSNQHSLRLSATLVSDMGPFPDIGYVGIPYHGNSCIMSLMTISSSNTEVFAHEGIMQEVSGFTIGNNYVIELFQSVTRNIVLRDTSGSWLVGLDDDLLGVTDPSISHLAFDDVNLNWDKRELTFTATKESYLIKFLPMDDDEEHLGDSTLLDGGLLMGLDFLSIKETTPNQELTKVQKRAEVYPSLVNDQLNIKLKTGTTKAQYQLIDNLGRIYKQEDLSDDDNLIDIPKLLSGKYYIRVFSNNFSEIHPIQKI